MNNASFYYTALSIFFAGFATVLAMESTYNHLKKPRTGFLPSLFMNYTAMIYLFSDALAAVFVFVVNRESTYLFFILLRDVTPFIFLVGIPFFLGSVRQAPKRVNGLMAIIALISAASACAITIVSPDMLLYPLPTFNGSRITASALISPEGGPLLVVRNALIAVFFLYSVIITVFLKSPRIDNSVFKKSSIGILLFGFFFFSYLYSIIFPGNEAGRGTTPFPFLSTGLVFLLFFKSIRDVDISNEHYADLIRIKNDLDRILTRDPLLGLPNRAGFIRDLQSEIDAAVISGSSFSVLFIDIDDFQNLNESYGESVGDTILNQFAQRMTELFAEIGNLYRMGGDDFAFILRKTDSENIARDIAGMIITSLRNPFQISGSPYLITASIGILMIPRDGDTPETIIKNAYSVMRNAKITKNTYSVFSPDLLGTSSGIIHTVNLLRDSINRDLFTLFYQPIVDGNKRIIFAEALLRCTNPDPSLGGPGHFIPIIQKAGLAKEVDNMVIHKAFHGMETLFERRLKISINLSTDQLVNHKYSEFLASFAQQHEIENRNIILEVTENQLMSNLASGRESLKKLREKGFSIALDDFGTGFSSLAYLAELPIDILKTDIIFARSVPGDRRKEAMARHIVELAHSLDIKVVAEGIETLEQFDFFKKLKSDYFQGYLFARPMPLPDLVKHCADQ